MKQDLANRCRIPDSDLMEFGLHGGRTTSVCQRCQSSICEAHTVVYHSGYDRQSLCSLCNKLVAANRAG
jgi:hypothetical protein